MGFQRDVSRREFLRSGAAAGASLTILGTPATAAAIGRRRSVKPTVAVLGGGMAGLATAHELVERGFAVTVYERKALGGKARSIGVPGTGAGGRRPLPGEHGFRFFPGFYHHVPDTMRRIPFPGNPNGVHDNMKAASGGKFLRSGGRPDALVFGLGPDPQQALTVDGLRRNLTFALSQDGIPPHELAHFVQRVLVFLTSSDERRYGQWEHVSWWDFIGAASRSEDYKTVLAAGLTRNLVAAKETVASTRTIGNMAEAFVLNIMGRGNDGALDRVLDAPTNEAWIDPWILHLTRLGVRFEVGTTVTSLKTAGGRVIAAGARSAKGAHRRIEADWFVCAMPVERARKLWNAKVLAQDPSLEAMHELQYEWMNGIQFFLKRKVDITKGHVTFVDAPWALTALTQGQFWNRHDFARDYGDGTAVDCLSMDISNWDAPGVLFSKPAKRCTADEIAKEVWAQVKQHETAAKVLTDDIVHSWHLDPGIRWVPSRGANRNDDPLLVNTVSSWEKRPTARTEVPNLFLAGDYVQTDIDLATMEGANESGRAAVNALLDAAGAKAERVAMFKLYDPPEFEPLKAADRELFEAGQPNALDHP
jgi:uncharacterized protein with NAD-binding domain and iron-sulfur cluster